MQMDKTSIIKNGYVENQPEEVDVQYQHLRKQLAQLRRLTSAEMIVLIMSKITNANERALFQGSIHGLSLSGLQVKCAQVLAVLQGETPFEEPIEVKARETLSQFPPEEKASGKMLIVSKAIPIEPEKWETRGTYHSLIGTEIDLAVLVNKGPAVRSWYNSEIPFAVMVKDDRNSVRPEGFRIPTNPLPKEAALTVAPGKKTNVGLSSPFAKREDIKKTEFLHNELVARMAEMPKKAAQLVRELHNSHNICAQKEEVSGVHSRRELPSILVEGDNDDAEDTAERYAFDSEHNQVEIPENNNVIPKEFLNKREITGMGLYANINTVLSKKITNRKKEDNK